jgi:hypothetical protein
MSKSKLYKSLIQNEIQRIRDRIDDEDKQKKRQQLEDDIHALLTSSKKRPNYTEARIYLEILKQECPLVMQMTDLDIIRAAKDILDVNLTWKHLFTLHIGSNCNNPYYKIIYL